ncbi:MAG: COX15/CtaA family protein [Rhodoferax sp.]
MMAHPAYDLSPSLGLLVLAALLSLGPLLWLVVRNRGSAPSAARRLQSLRLLTLFLTFDLVLFGAFTRLTDSGLGCPDWPGCYGNTTPLGAVQPIEQAQQHMPSGPVTHQKAWIEMVHRYLAMMVGALIVCQSVAGAWTWRRASAPERAQLLAPAWGWAALVWVCVQGAFGAWTVTLKLMPAIVTLHLLGALGLLALLGWSVALGAQRLAVSAEPGAQVDARRTGLGRWALTGTAGLLLVQIALGGWVSTNYAVLACQAFPSCQGQWWPDMNFAQGFTLWRPLGVMPSGEPLQFAALTAIHMAHRIMALLVLLVLFALAWRLWACPVRGHLARALAALAALQAVTGVSNVVLAWPLVAALLHTGGAAALVGVLTALMATRSPAAQPRAADFGAARVRTPDGRGLV